MALNGSFGPVNQTSQEKIKAGITSRELGDPGLRRAAILVEIAAFTGALTMMLAGNLEADKWPEGIWLAPAPTSSWRGYPS